MSEDAEETEDYQQWKSLRDKIEEQNSEIKRLKGINIEMAAWINKRKNKIHPADPIHAVLERAREATQ